MLRVLTCLGAQFDPSYLALAGAVCLFGSYTSTKLAAHAFNVRSSVKLPWLFLAGLAVGTTAWATHFVALLATLGGPLASFHPVLLILSLLLAVGGVQTALVVASSERRGPWPALGGTWLGFVVAGTHYFTFFAVRAEDVRWDVTDLLASVAIAAAFGALSTMAVRGQLAGHRGVRAAPFLLVATIAGFHVAGMTAAEIVPSAAGKALSAEEVVALAALIISAAGLIVLAVSCALLIERQTSREAQERMEGIALTDAVTGLPNRAAFLAELRERVRKAKDGDCFAVAVIEIFELHSIVQRYGARAADTVARAVANRLSEASDHMLFAARTGNRQFCAIREMADPAEAVRRAQRLHGLVSGKFVIGSHDIAVDVRVGLVTFPHDAQEEDGLLRKAQAALATALADPLQPVACFDAENESKTQRRLLVAQDLRDALDRGQFALFYQPQVWIAQGQTIGYEALLRWRHPELGTVSPAEFIPIAEKSGQILPIGTWVMRAACQEAVRWPDGWRVAVNVSALQLRQADFPEIVGAALAQSGLPPDQLEIELTESLLIDDRERALRTLRRLKMLGVRLVLDDFGTGYSSMDVLRRFPFDKVKLDKSFIDDVETDRQARAILRAMLSLGQELSLPVLVEGVETERQLSILRHEGCTTVQGYLFGRPLPAESIPHRPAERQLA